MKFSFVYHDAMVSVYAEHGDGRRRFLGSLLMTWDERAAFETMVALAGRPVRSEAHS